MDGTNTVVFFLSLSWVNWTRIIYKVSFTIQYIYYRFKWHLETPFTSTQLYTFIKSTLNHYSLLLITSFFLMCSSDTLYSPNYFFSVHWYLIKVHIHKQSQQSLFESSSASKILFNAFQVYYHPNPTHSYEDEQIVFAYNPYNLAFPGVTMITEETYPYASTTESYDYAKEVTTLTTHVPYGEDADLGEEGPTECDCEPGEPGFAGFPGPKVHQESFGRIFVNYAVVLMSLLISHCNQGSVGPKGKQGFPGAQGREVRSLEFDQKLKPCALNFNVSRMSQYFFKHYFISCCQGYKGTKGVRGQGGDPGPDVSSYHHLTSYSYLDHLDHSLSCSNSIISALPAFSHFIGWSWTWWRGWCIWFLWCNGEWKMDLTSTVWPWSVSYVCSNSCSQGLPGLPGDPGERGEPGLKVKAS